jgi:hypothetical protein
MRNVSEDLLREVYDELKSGIPGWKDTLENREDVLVYALNRVPAHYVATTRGEVMTRMNMLRDQLRADATVALMEGFRFVAAKPRPSGKATQQG